MLTSQWKQFPCVVVYERLLSLMWVGLKFSLHYSNPNVKYQLPLPCFFYSHLPLKLLFLHSIMNVLDGSMQCLPLGMVSILKLGMISLSSQSEHLCIPPSVFLLCLFLLLWLSFFLLAVAVDEERGEMGGANVPLNKNLGGAQYWPWAGWKEVEERLEM